MSYPRATRDSRQLQQRLTVTALAAIRRAWGGMGADFDTSWRRVAPQLILLLSASQLRAATNGAAYVSEVLAETSQHDDPAGVVRPRQFAGAASDGRPLPSLLYGAVATSKRHVANGAEYQTALTYGRRWLDMAVTTQIADAYRGSTGVAIAARPRVEGYARALTPPSCPRCAILAGRWYRWNAAFDRHPRCDCSQIPVSERAAGDYRTDPDKAFEADQITGLTEAERAALDSGADMSRVVNARRGASGLRSLTTTELSGRRVGRMTPEGIYAEAATRDDAIRLLIENGYLR